MGVVPIQRNVCGYATCENECRGINEQMGQKGECSDEQTGEKNITNERYLGVRMSTQIRPKGVCYV